MKPIKGQTRADWMAKAIPHFKAEGQTEEEAIKTAAEMYLKDGDESPRGIELKVAIKKTKFTPEEVKALCKSRNIEYQDGDEGRVAVFEISNERVDRDGDIIVQEGIDLKNFRANPVVLWGHDGFSPPVGASLKEELEKDNKGSRWVATVLFHKATDLANAVCELVKMGYVRAVSVGFRPKMPGGVVFPDEAMRAELGMRPGGVIFRMSELFEFSVCSIPANPFALSRETAKSISKAARDFGLEKGIFTADEDLSDIVDTEEEVETSAQIAEKRKTALAQSLQALQAKYPKAFGNKTEGIRDERIKAAFARIDKTFAKR